MYSPLRLRLRGVRLSPSLAGGMEFVFLSGSESPDSTQHRQIRTPMEVARASPNVSPNVFLGCESVGSNLCLDGCGLGAKCGNRGQRPQLQWRLGRRLVVFMSGYGGGSGLLGVTPSTGFLLFLCSLAPS
jgi:hypothetical protein